MEKKYKFVIIDNETSEVKEEIDTDCIIAGVRNGDGANSICITQCNAKALAESILAAEKVIETMKSQHPIVEAFCRIAKLSNSTSDGEDDE